VVVLAPDRPAAAALAAVALALTPVLARRAPLAWSLPALAPVLGLAALAGGFPAIAGRARSVAARAGLGAAGAVWALLAEPVLGRALVLGAAPSPGWDRDAGRALTRAAWPLVTSGAVLLAVLWALAAVLLPWIVRGRSLVLDLVMGTTWAAGFAAATAALGERVTGAEPPGVVAGALAAGGLALMLPRGLPRARDTVDGSRTAQSGY
jgi:eukaryotic-like serine/threonine-protein kinase